MLFQSMSIVVHFAPLASMAAKSAFCSASDSHRICTDGARPARDETCWADTVPLGRLQARSVALYCFTQPVTSSNATAAATNVARRGNRRGTARTGDGM